MSLFFLALRKLGQNLNPLDSPPTPLLCSRNLPPPTLLQELETKTYLEKREPSYRLPPKLFSKSLPLSRNRTTS